MNSITLKTPGISRKTTDLRPEHPPLGKLIIVAGIEIFGDNPWGWRFFPILFGTASIVLFYFLCRRLDMSRNASNIATFLLAFENMTFRADQRRHARCLLPDFYDGGVPALCLPEIHSFGNLHRSERPGQAQRRSALPAIVIHWIFTRQGRSSGFSSLFSSPFSPSWS